MQIYSVVAQVGGDDDAPAEPETPGPPLEDPSIVADRCWEQVGSRLLSSPNLVDTSASGSFPDSLPIVLYLRGTGVIVKKDKFVDPKGSGLLLLGRA